MCRVCGALLKPKAWVLPPQEARVPQALLVRREAIAQDLHRERNRQEQAGATDTPALIHKSLEESIEFLAKQLAQLQKDIDEHIDKHSNLQKDRALLQSIPAIGPQVGSNILSVMHNHDFGSAEQLAAYLGLVPVERQSDSSVLGRARMSKAGPARIRAVLYMAGVVGTRSTHTSKLFMSACLPEASPRCPPSVLQCASWCICALAYSKLNSRINTIT